MLDGLLEAQRMTRVITIKLDAAVDFANASAILKKFGVTDIRPDVPGGVAMEGLIDPTKYEACKRELIAGGYFVV